VLAANETNANATPAPICDQCSAAPRPEAAPNTSSAKAKPANKMGMLQSTAFSAWCLYNTRAQKAVDKG